MQRLQKVLLTCLMGLSVHASYSMEENGDNKSFYKGPADLKQYVLKGAKYGAIAIGLYGLANGLRFGGFVGLNVGGLSYFSSGDMSSVPVYAVAGGLAGGAILATGSVAVGGATGALSGLAAYCGKHAAKKLFNGRYVVPAGAVIGGTTAAALCGLPLWYGVAHSALTVYGASRLPKRIV